MSANKHPGQPGDLGGTYSPESSAIPSPRPLRLEPLSREAFAAYGVVLEQDPANPEPFQALFAEPDSRGWRVAILRVEEGPLPRLHRHPDSHECFAPLTGEPALAVARAEAPGEIRLFRLDRPVCVHMHVWHQMVSLTPLSTVFIAENAAVSGESLPFAAPLAFEA